MTQLELPGRGPSLTRLDEGFEALRRDLIHEDGPRISTMRNYRFAILQYDPRLEFECRARVQRLSLDLERSGWVVFSISLEKLLFDRIRAEGPEFVERVARMEAVSARRGPARGLNYLKSKLEPLIDPADAQGNGGGLAGDCVELIGRKVAENPDRSERMLCLIGRAGALYPFFRTSALLRNIAGKTHNVPVVLLYPGERIGKTGLSFMGQLPPDHDYRPRIYP